MLNSPWSCSHALFSPTPLAMVFIDGGHSLEAALCDYRSWAPHVVQGGILAIHDIFPDPTEGGQAPHEIWKMAHHFLLHEPQGRAHRNSESGYP